MTNDTESGWNGNMNLWMTGEPKVISPTDTGSDDKSRNDVTGTDCTNRGDLCIVIQGPLMLVIVVTKLIAPKMDETPDR
jgi:hypothetical protein